MYIVGHRHPVDLLDFPSSPGAFSVAPRVVRIVGDIHALASRVLLDVTVSALATDAGGEAVAYGTINLGTVFPGETIPFELTIEVLADAMPAIISLHPRCSPETLPWLQTREPPAPF